MDYVLSLIFGAIVVVVVLELVNVIFDNVVHETIAAMWLRQQKAPPHDPMDWRKSKTSGSWHTGQYCVNCKGWTNHDDRMSGICSHCGSKKGVRAWRSVRAIWNGKKWIAQYKYDDGLNDYELSE